MKWLFKKAVGLFKPLIFWYLRKPRSFSYKKMRITVFPGVFHPGLFFSTKYLLAFLETLELTNKTLLELGAGSGAVGFYAETLGAKVTLSDISTIAINGLEANARNLNSQVKIIESDLFKNISDRFDYVVVNPPYYPKAPAGEAEMAWFCGANFEYFEVFFEHIGAHLSSNGICYMVLSEDCAIGKIESIAHEHGLELSVIDKKRIYWEWNYIFSVTPS